MIPSKIKIKILANCDIFGKLHNKGLIDAIPEWLPYGKG